MILFKHELRQGRNTLLIWSGVIAFMLGICIFIYPEMKDQMGDISGLRDENIRVTVRKPKEKEIAAAGRGKKARSTDALTSAGYQLFERLRQLRTAIAKEEGMPPYIIFSDKTLIDMCVKMPSDRRGMLAVSGVGENKFGKYGQRFIDEITAFAASHPGAVFGAEGLGDRLD